MSYSKPQTRVRHSYEPTTTVDGSAELPSAILAPAYQLFDRATHETSFNPLVNGGTSFSGWPDLPTGAVVDLAGVRGKKIDKQIVQAFLNPQRDREAVVPTFHLVDGDTTYEVDRDHIKSIDQSGFTIEEAAKNGKKRVTRDVYRMEIEGDKFIYDPDGQLGDIKSGDVFKTTGSTIYTVDQADTNRLDVGADNPAFTSPVTEIESDGTDNISISAGSTAGRINVSSDATFSSSVSSGDPLIYGVYLNGMSNISATYDSTSSGVVSFTSVNFNADFKTSDVVGKPVRMKNSAGITFGTIESVDTSNGTMDVDLEGDTLHDETDTSYTLTAFREEYGYIDSVDADDKGLTAVVPNVVSQTETFVHVAEPSLSVDFFPTFDVEVTYRASRKDLANDVIEITAREDIENKIHAPTFNDPLTSLCDLHWSMEESDAPFYAIPVDPEPGSSTGLPKNYDRTQGYKDALSASTSVEDIYTLLLGEYNQILRDEVESHLKSQDDPNVGKRRKAIMWANVPQGDYDRTKGIVEPGRSPTGIVTSEDEGNHVIKDDGLKFVDEAGVEEGDEVVVTYPDQIAGTYKATSATTNDVLVLDRGDWSVNHIDRHDKMDVEEDSGYLIFSDGSLDASFFERMQVGDYVEADIDLGSGEKTYRLRVVDTDPSGGLFKAAEEVAGSVSFSGTKTAENISVIRTFSPDTRPAVQYHIRPLSPGEQVDRLINKKTTSFHRVLYGLAGRPKRQTGTTSLGDPIKKYLSPAHAFVSAAAKRCSIPSYEDYTGLYVGGGLEEIEYAFNHFDERQKNDLAENGFFLFDQDGRGEQPYFRDTVSSDHRNGYARFQEAPMSNADWQAEYIESGFGYQKGTKPKRFNENSDGGGLTGLRFAELNNLLSTWVNEGRLVDYEITTIREDPSNPGTLEVVYDARLPTYEKIVDVTMNIEV